MDLKNEQAYQRAYNLKKHLKKLEEIHKSPTRRLDNRLPDIFLNKRKNKGYDILWREYVVNKENLNLLNRLIEIKSKNRHASNNDTSKFDRSEKEAKGESLIVDISTASIKTIPKVYKAKLELGAKSVPRRHTRKLDPL